MPRRGHSPLSYVARVAAWCHRLPPSGHSNRFYDNRYERRFDVQMVEMRGTVCGVVGNNMPSLNQVCNYGYDAKQRLDFSVSVSVSPPPLVRVAPSLPRWRGVVRCLSAAISANSPLLSPLSTAPLRASSSTRSACSTSACLSPLRLDSCVLSPSDRHLPPLRSFAPLCPATRHGSFSTPPPRRFQLSAPPPLLMSALSQRPSLINADPSLRSSSVAVRTGAQLVGLLIAVFLAYRFRPIWPRLVSHFIFLTYRFRPNWPRLVSHLSVLKRSGSSCL